MTAMLRTFFLLITCFFLNNLSAQKSDVFVNGYLKNDGTYIQPHFRTTPNNSMFDNYSTKGNYNPYTGKPGWIDPYLKVSNSYYARMPATYKPDYGKLFIYLNKKDSYNYFRIVDNFGYEYKLFFTGLFRMNMNEVKEANRIFDVLRGDKGVNEFIAEESSYWYDITLKYLDATEEFEDLYSSTEKYEKEKNYDGVLNRLNHVKNPLNFYHKYLIKVTFEERRYNYSDAIKALDSLILYSSDIDLQDTLISNYSNLVSYFRNKNNFLITNANGTFNYPFETLFKNFHDYVLNSKIPIADLDKACFKIDISQCTNTDTIVTRTITDTAESRSMKFNSLSFFVHTYKDSKDTLFGVSLKFTDSTSYKLYLNEVSDFKQVQSLAKSLLYKYDNTKDNRTGSEYLVNDVSIVGLTKDMSKESDLTFYRLYIYCFKRDNTLTDLSFLFK